MRYETFIGKRYLFSPRQDRSISVITWISIGGVALGVVALIVSTSVMNGFRTNLRNAVTGSLPHITVFAWDDEMECIPLRDVNPTTPEKWLVQMDPALLEGNVRMKFLPTKESGIVGVEFVPYFDVNDEWFTSYPCYM